MSPYLGLAPCGPLLRAFVGLLTALAIGSLMAGCSGKEPTVENAWKLEVDGQARIDDHVKGDKKADATARKHLDTQLMVEGACELAQFLHESMSVTRTSETSTATVSKAKPSKSEAVQTESIVASTARVEFKPLPLDSAISLSVNQRVRAKVCETEKLYRGTCRRDQEPAAAQAQPPRDHLALLEFMQATHGMRAHARWESVSSQESRADKSRYMLLQTLEMDRAGYTCTSTMVSEERR